MTYKISDLQLVILKNPYDSMQSKITQGLFSKLLALRIRGYRQFYPYGILPFDATDYIADHIVVCPKEANELDPIMVFKKISFSTCTQFKQSFPPLNLMRVTKNVEHEKAIQILMDRCENQAKDIFYYSSWTISPEVKQKDKQLVPLLRDIFVYSLAMMCLDQQNEESILGSTVKAKIEDLYKSIGFQELQIDGKNLPEIEVPFAFNDKSKFLFTKKINNEFLNGFSKDIKSLWKERMIIEVKDKAIKIAA